MRSLFALLFVTSFLGSALPAAAVVKVGDVLVADVIQGVLQIDGANQAVTVLVPTIAHGGTQVVSPIGIAIGPASEIYVLDLGSAVIPAAVWKIDPLTGFASTVSSGGLFKQPRSIAVGPDGSIYVADIGTTGSNGAVIKIQPGGGAQSTLTAGGQPWALAVDRTGNVYVSRYPQTRVESFAPNGLLRWVKSTAEFSPVTMCVDAQDLVYMFGLNLPSGYSDSFVLDPTSQTLTHYIDLSSTDPPNGAVFLPNYDLVVSLTGGLFPVVVVIHPDGSYGWRVGDYHVNPFWTPAGLAVFGVADGTVPVRPTSWGEVKGRYRR